jgi:hypothetical protein
MRTSLLWVLFFLSIVGSLHYPCSVRGAAPSLAVALDTTNLVWTTGGTSNWEGQTTNTHDAVDAAQSGPLPDRQTNWIATVVTGPGTVTFWWRVSSEPGWDYLRFYIGGQFKAETSGVDAPWQQQSYPVPTGSQTLRWAYEKDVLGWQGMDAGWVDQVTFTPTAPAPPVITVQPQSQTVFAGQRAVFSASATGSELLVFRWQVYAQGAFVDFATAATLVLTNLSTNAGGSYRVVVTNAYGTATSSNALLTVLPPVALPPALNEPDLTWRGGGANLWLGETNLTHDGASAAQSGHLRDGQANWIETTVPGPGVVSFWWRVSSEFDYDFLRFSINGLELTNLSGETGWQFQSFALPSGNQTLRWQYSKDPFGAAGLDAGWVDQVTYQPGPSAPPLILVSCPDGLGFDAGKAFRFSFRSRLGASHVVEHKADLKSTNWTVLTNVTGTGPKALVVDPTPTGPRRVYRVRNP